MGPMVRAGVALLLFTFVGLPAASAGKLDRAGDAARGRDRDSDSSNSSDSSGSSSSSSGAEPSSPGDLAIVLTFPWLGPYQAVEAERPRHADYRMRFARYPYADDTRGQIVDPVDPPPQLDPETGLAVSDPEDAADADRPANGKRVAAQLSAESGLDVAGAVWRSGFAARLQLPSRFEFDADWSLFSEYTQAGEDRMLLGREHVAFRFAEAPAVQFRTGIGARHLIDEEGGVHGVDLTYGIDAFLSRPVVLGLEGSFGFLGEAAAGALRAQLGFLVNRFELAAGWDYRNIGGVEFSGPFLMVRAWL